MWLLIGICTIGFGQVVTILDDATGQPVELAILTSDKHKTGEVTNHEGQINITLFAGEEHIVIRSLGYHPEYVSFTELADMKYVIRFQRVKNI